jgi:hypothetical protein
MKKTPQQIEADVALMGEFSHKTRTIKLNLNQLIALVSILKSAQANGITFLSGLRGQLEDIAESKNDTKVHDISKDMLNTGAIVSAVERHLKSGE